MNIKEIDTFFGEKSKTRKDTEFGKRLREVRLKSGFTQEQVSRILNAGACTYGTYETATSIPDARTVAKLAILFNTTTDYLLGIDDTQEETEISEELFAKLAMLNMRLSTKAVDKLLKITASKACTEILELLIDEDMFINLLFYLDTYYTLGAKLPANVTDNAKEKFEKVTQIDFSKLPIGVDHYPSERVTLRDVYSQIINTEFSKIVDSIYRKNKQTFKHKLLRMLSDIKEEQ